MPCPTRFPIANVERKGAEHLDDYPSPKTWNPEQSRTDIAGVTAPE